MENLGKSVSKIIDTVRLDAAAPTEATIMALISSDNAFNACMKEIKSSECLATDKVSLAASQAMKEIEEAFSDIHNSLVAAKGDHAAISHFDKSSNLLIHQIQQNSQSDRTNAPEKLSMLSGVYKNVLKNALSCAKSTNDQVLQQNVVEQIRELGGSTLKFFELLLKPEISDIDFRKRKNLIIREISQETSNLNAVLLEGLIGIQAGQKMRDDVDLIITEVESCLIFAQAKQLNPDGESGKAFTTSVKDIILQEAQGLTELVKGYVTEIQNQTSQKDVADLFVKTNTSLQATINACIQGASCLSSDESEKQEKLLAISAELGESTKSMIMAFQQANFDQSMTGDFKKSAALELDTINKLVTIVKSLGDASEEFNHNISELTQSIDNDLQTLKNNDPALGSALPADLVHISRQLAAAVINVIGSVAGNEQDLFAKMGKVVNTISDLTRTAKASVSGAPEDQKSIVLDSAAELSQSCRAFISEVGSTLHVALVPRKQALNLKIKDITAAVASVAQSAASLIPTGYEDPNDPNVIAERELLTAANAIEAAAKKLSLLKPAEKPREANQELNFEEQIVEGTSI